MLIAEKGYRVKSTLYLGLVLMDQNQFDGLIYMPIDCTVHHWSTSEQSLYVEGSHTNMQNVLESC